MLEVWISFSTMEATGGHWWLMWSQETEPAHRFARRQWWRLQMAALCKRLKQGNANLPRGNVRMSLRDANDIGVSSREKGSPPGIDPFVKSVVRRGQYVPYVTVNSDFVTWRSSLVSEVCSLVGGRRAQLGPSKEQRGWTGTDTKTIRAARTILGCCCFVRGESSFPTTTPWDIKKKRKIHRGWALEKETETHTRWEGVVECFK